MASLNTLHPWLQPYAKYLFSVGKFYDSRLVVTSARRSVAEQAKLYQAYLSGKSLIPAAPPGRSLHQHGLSFDMARLGIDPLGDPFLAELGRLWQSWGGEHGGPRDPVHFQPRM